MKRKCICKNCGHRHRIDWLKDQQDAGFGLQHLSCKNCGQQALELSTKDTVLESVYSRFV